MSLEKEKETLSGLTQQAANEDCGEASEDINKIIDWVNQLKDPNLRVNSLIQLSKKREAFSDLATYLWYTPGVICILLQEIIDTYRLLAPPNLTIQESNHTCNVLALFQCIAAHSDTRPHLLNAQIPIFLYPFLNTVNKNKPFEYLRLTALGVIGALVKVDNSDVINFLLSTEIIPLCLRIMERGSELSKTVATFIVQRILLDENGLNYVCNTAERFYAVSSVLFNMINVNPTGRLIKHIIRCYARLSENPRVSSILKENLPTCFKDKNFVSNLDEGSKRWLQSLLKNLSFGQSQTQPQLTKNVNMNMGNLNMNMNSMNLNMMQSRDTSSQIPNSNINPLTTNANNSSTTGPSDMFSYNPNTYPGFSSNFDPYYFNSTFQAEGSNPYNFNKPTPFVRDMNNPYYYETGKNQKN